MGYITLSKGAQGIVELVFDQPGSSVNTMGLEYDAAMKAAVAALQGMVAAGGVKGVYVRSGKPGQFFAGGDIKEMLEMDLDVPVERIKEFQKAWTDFLTARKPDVLKNIAAEKALSESLTAALKASADQFKQTWK